LSIEILQIFVIGDCESTAGNPGEFSYRGVVQLGGIAGIPGPPPDEHETSGFPSEAGAVELSEDVSPVALANADLTLMGVTADRVADVTLTFSVIEWDTGMQDPDMSFRIVEGQVPFDASRDLIRAIDVGASNACRLSFEFLVHWSVS
jgi:hypothetical protein